MKDGFLTEFREFTGLKVITAESPPDREPSGGRSPALLTGNRIISGLQRSGRRFWRRMTGAIPYSAWLLMGQAKYIFEFPDGRDAFRRGKRPGSSLLSFL